MELRQYVAALRRHRIWVVASLVVCIGGAAILALSTAPVYTSNIQLFVSSNGTSTDPTATYQGGLFSEERVLSYAEIVSSPVVLDPVIRQLGLRLDSQQLGGEINASVPTNTVLLDVAVQDRSARRARAIAAAVGTQLITFVSHLETPVGGHDSAVKVTVTSPAQLPTSPTSPRKTVYLAIGLILGLILGVGGAMLLDALTRPTPVRKGGDAPVGHAAPG
jgi:succinoglycan biosynthesis transport protein ExoP